LTTGSSSATHQDCEHCGAEIPEARLEAMPDAKHCVNCADLFTMKPVGRILYNHKTAGELYIAKDSNTAATLEATYRRQR
jgi:hypothetical protein